MGAGLCWIAATGSNPLDHVVQHSIKDIPADLGLLTPDGVITLFSDHIAMILLAGLVLTIGLPILVRKRRGTTEVDRLVLTGPANAIEAICGYLRKEVAEPAATTPLLVIEIVWT